MLSAWGWGFGVHATEIQPSNGLDGGRKENGKREKVIHCGGGTRHFKWLFGDDSEKVHDLVGSW